MNHERQATLMANEDKVDALQRKVRYALELTQAIPAGPEYRLRAIREHAEAVKELGIAEQQLRQLSRVLSDDDSR